MFLNSNDDGLRKQLKNMPITDYEALGSMNQTIVKVADKSNHMVDSILLSLKTSVIASDKNSLNIKDVVEEAIKEYATYNPNALNVKLKFTNNFKVKASSHYLKHVMFNLFEKKQNLKPICQFYLRNWY